MAFFKCALLVPDGAPGPHLRGHLHAHLLRRSQEGADQRRLEDLLLAHVLLDGARIPGEEYAKNVNYVSNFSPPLISLSSTRARPTSEAEDRGEKGRKIKSTISSGRLPLRKQPPAFQAAKDCTFFDVAKPKTTKETANIGTESVENA